MWMNACNAVVSRLWTIAKLCFLSWRSHIEQRQNKQIKRDSFKNYVDKRRKRNKNEGEGKEKESSVWFRSSFAVRSVALFASSFVCWRRWILRLTQSARDKTVFTVSELQINLLFFDFNFFALSLCHFVPLSFHFTFFVPSRSPPILFVRGRYTRNVMSFTWAKIFCWYFLVVGEQFNSFWSDKKRIEICAHCQSEQQKGEMRSTANKSKLKDFFRLSLCLYGPTV